MGDRVHTELTLLTVDLRRAQRILKRGGYEADDHYDYNNGEYTVLSFQDVNYGNFDCEQILIEEGIPYDKTWEAGSEFGKGTEYIRFTEEGEVIRLEVYEDEKNPPIEKLIELAGDYPKLKAYILDWQQNKTPLPWKDQEAFAKIYRTKKLLTK